LKGVGNSAKLSIVSSRSTCRRCQTTEPFLPSSTSGTISPEPSRRWLRRPPVAEQGQPVTFHPADPAADSDIRRTRRGQG
jgi:hypothetical protein